MKNIKYPILALALLAVSCQKSDDGSNGASEAVSFTVNSDLSTRATLTESWAVGDKVGVSSVIDGIINAEYAVSSEAGALSPSTPIAITYPNYDGITSYCFAYAPFNADFNSEEMPIDLATNQLDLIVSGFEEFTYKQEEVEFTFSHALSYLALNLEFADEFIKDSGFGSADEIEASNIEVYIGGYSQGELVPSFGTEEDWSTASLYAVLDATDAASQANINFEVSGESNAFTANALIFPNDYTSADATVYFRFTTGNYLKIYNTKLSAVLAESEAKAVAGYKYTYTATIGRDEVTFTPITDSNITGWDDVPVTD